MANELMTYIQSKRDAGVKDDQIKANMIAAGWPSDQVEAGLKADTRDVPPPPAMPVVAPLPSATSSVGVRPIAVSNVATTRGIEYTIMFIGLWISATAIGSLLHAMIDSVSGKSETFSEQGTPFASAAVLVALPIFAFLFLRLKRAEHSEPDLRSDPSRKHAIQLTLIVTFIIGIGKVISYIYSLMNGGADGGFLRLSGNVSDVAISPVFDILHTGITLLIAGGIFAYYWRDIHKKDV